MYDTRLQTMRQIIRDAGLDAVALVPGANLYYMTGQPLHLMERPTVGLYRAQGDPILILPALEKDKFAAPPYPLELFTYSDEEGPAGAFEGALAALNPGAGRLGVEGLRMRFAETRLLAQHAPGAELADADDALAALRLRKGPAEIEAMRQAIQISQDALRAVVGMVRPGMDERSIANTLQVEMLQRGGESPAFEPIVLTGPNSALPHGLPGERRIAEGDLLLVDYGTTHAGYAADITRTFVLGELRDQRLIDAYAAVQAANAAGRRAAGPGVPCQEVDRAARAEIVKAGFGEYFRHRTGHGLGLDVHEGPYIREGNAQLLEPGNVFTVEPGVYFAGVGGVRIEDNVVITEDGAESLSTFPRDLESIG